MATEYVIAAANEMHTIMSGSLGQPSGQAIRRAANIGCNTLKQLQNDVQFYQNLKQQLGWVHDGSRQVAGILLDWDHFEMFLRLEARVLEAAGVYPSLVRNLIAEARHQMEIIRHGSIDAITDPPDIISLIVKLEKLCCGVAIELEERAIIIEQQIRNRRLIKNVSYGVAGLAMVVVNGSVLATTLGLSMYGSAASTTLGGAILGAAVTGRVTLVDDSPTEPSQ